jgi:four helix bundle protein
MAETIEKLRIYKTACELEAKIRTLVDTLPVELFNGVGNELRSSSSAVTRHIMETHRLYSYRLKIDALADARRAAEMTQHYLETIHNVGMTADITEAYTSVIKQSWGLTKWLKIKVAEKQDQLIIEAKDMAAA